jgi:hypothetical protein
MATKRQTTQTRKVERSSQLTLPSDDRHPAAFRNPPDDGTDPDTVVFMLILLKLRAAVALKNSTERTADKDKDKDAAAQKALK